MSEELDDAPRPLPVRWFVAAGLVAMPLALIGEPASAVVTGVGLASTFLVLGQRPFERWHAVGLFVALLTVVYGVTVGLEEVVDDRGQPVPLTPTVRMQGSGWMRAAGGAMQVWPRRLDPDRRSHDVPLPSVRARGLFGITLAYTRYTLELRWRPDETMFARVNLAEGQALNGWEALGSVGTIAAQADGGLRFEWYYRLQGPFGRAYRTPARWVLIRGDGTVSIDP